jgi:3-methyladenine DNA glycosylase Tag
MSTLTIRQRPAYGTLDAVKFTGTEESADEVIKFFKNHGSFSKYVYKFSDGSKHVSIHHKNRDGDVLVYRISTCFIKNNFRYGGFEAMCEKEFADRYEAV